jgi:hypothetical protein
MTILLAILAAVAAVAVIAFMLRLAPGRTERVPPNTQRSGGQGEELSPSDRAA